jgi:hypothetical protein
MTVRLSSLRTGHALLTRNIIFQLLVLISVRGRVKPRGLVWSEGLALCYNRECRGFETRWGVASIILIFVCLCEIQAYTGSLHRVRFPYTKYVSLVHGADGLMLPWNKYSIKFLMIFKWNTIMAALRLVSIATTNCRNSISVGHGLYCTYSFSPFSYHLRSFIQFDGTL